jgi:hypothetical protein
MTTVRAAPKDFFKTPYGTIEYTHTKRGWSEILPGIKTVEKQASSIKMLSLIGVIHACYVYELKWNSFRCPKRVF